MIVRRLGFDERSPLDTARFAAPAAQTMETQLSLL
jgi:hypothetical protein